jgi:hypothetical protein
MIVSTHGIVANSGGVSKLLDVYTGASVAYSLRKLRTAYTGYAIRVRRSSDNTSLDIGFDSNGNLDTSSLTSFVGANNGYVTIWYNQSDLNPTYNIQQPTSAQQPQIVSSGSVILDNGKPSVKFTSQRIGNTIPFTNINLTNHSIFYAGYSVGTGVSYGALVNIQTSPADNPDLRLASGADIYSYWNGTYQINGNYNMNVRKVYSSIINGNKTHTVWGNGTQLATGSKTGTFNPINELTLGGFVGTNGYQNGYMSEFILYSNDQAPNRTGIETNINTYYAIY